MIGTKALLLPRNAGNTYLLWLSRPTGSALKWFILKINVFSLWTVSNNYFCGKSILCEIIRLCSVDVLVCCGMPVYSDSSDSFTVLITEQTVKHPLLWWEWSYLRSLSSWITWQSWNAQFTLRDSNSARCQPSDTNFAQWEQQNENNWAENTWFLYWLSNILGHWFLIPFLQQDRGDLTLR